MKNFEKYFIVALFSALTLLCFLQIIFRSFINVSLSWTEELARYVFILLVYMSACAAVLKDAHVRVEVIDGFISAKSKRNLDTVMDIVFIAFMALIGYYGVLISLDAFETESLSPAMQVPLGFVYAIIPVTFFLTCIRLFQKICLRYKSTESESEHSAGSES